MADTSSPGRIGNDERWAAGKSRRGRASPDTSCASVGPAGQLLDRALAEARIDRKRAYVTDAVKHFKFEPRGKRRLHKKPNTDEIQKCRWWLELDFVGPKLEAAFGATSVQSVLRETGAISKLHGRFMPFCEGPLR